MTMSISREQRHDMEFDKILALIWSGAILLPLTRRIRERVLHQDCPPLYLMSLEPFMVIYPSDVIVITIEMRDMLRSKGRVR